MEQGVNVDMEMTQSHAYSIVRWCVAGLCMHKLFLCIAHCIVSWNNIIKPLSLLCCEEVSHCLQRWWIILVVTLTLTTWALLSSTKHDLEKLCELMNDHL